MKQYKILRHINKSFSTKTHFENLEEAINQCAEDGWILHSFQRSWVGNETIFLFEKDT